jgi:hypothetical protein
VAPLTVPAMRDIVTPTVALTVVLATAASPTRAITSRTRSSDVRNPAARSSRQPTRASAVLPIAMPAAAPIGIGVVTLAMNAPAATAGHSSVPKTRSAASEIPVGAHTGVALPWATDRERPGLGRHHVQAGHDQCAKEIGPLLVTRARQGQDA